MARLVFVCMLPFCCLSCQFCNLNNHIRRCSFRFDCWKFKAIFQLIIAIFRFHSMSIFRWLKASNSIKKLKTNGRFDIDLSWPVLCLKLSHETSLTIARHGFNNSNSNSTTLMPDFPLMCSYYLVILPRRASTMALYSHASWLIRHWVEKRSFESFSRVLCSIRWATRIRNRDINFRMWARKKSHWICFISRLSWFVKIHLCTRSIHENARSIFNANFRVALKKSLFPLEIQKMLTTQHVFNVLHWIDVLLN